MNYARIYEEFIADRKIKEIDLLQKASDRHHIKPKCLGGDDEEHNLIRLSYSDHLFAHLLLAKIHGGVLISTVTRMSGMKRYCGGKRLRLAYHQMRIRHADSKRGPNPAHAERMRNRLLDPEKKATWLAQMQAGRDAKDFSAQCAERTKKRWAEGTLKSQIRAGHAAYLARPDTSEKLSRQARARFESPEARAVVSERTTKMWASDGYRERAKARMVALHKDPEFKAAHSARMIAINQDPQHRARVEAGKVAARERKRSAKSKPDE